jgi:hypothetical protein
MTDATILAIVTIVCTMITTSVGLIVRTNVIGLNKIIQDQTVELAKLHQTVISQSARIYDQEATTRGAGRQSHRIPSDEPYTANPPYRKE